MIQIESYGVGQFKINGIPHFRNYILVVNGNNISIVNKYDSTVKLAQNVAFSSFSVEGVSYDSLIGLIDVLYPLIYSDSSNNTTNNPPGESNPELPSKVIPLFLPEGNGKLINRVAQYINTIQTTVLTTIDRETFFLVQVLINGAIKKVYYQNILGYGTYGTSGTLEYFTSLSPGGIGILQYEFIDVVIYEDVPDDGDTPPNSLADVVAILNSSEPFNPSSFDNLISIVVGGNTTIYEYTGPNTLIGNGQTAIAETDLTVVDGIVTDVSTQDLQIPAADQIPVDGTPEFHALPQGDETAFGWLTGNDKSWGWLLQQYGIEGTFGGYYETIDGAGTNLLNAQGSQVSGSLYLVRDASFDTNVTTGFGLYKYLGTTVGDLTDYELQVVSTETSNPGSIINPKHYNIEDFGAKFDVVHLIDVISISSGSPNVTATGATFTNDDIGKVFVIKDAGASGADFVSEILTVQSSTTLTLNTNAGTTVTDVSGCYGTDDTLAIQSALEFCDVDGNENLPIVCPPRTTIINGDFDNTDNSQIQFPSRDFTDPSRKTISIKGTTAPVVNRTAGIGSAIDPVSGTLFLSTKFGSIVNSLDPSIVSGKGAPGTTNGLNYNTPHIENISFQVITDSNNATRTGGANFFESSACYIKNCTAFPYRLNTVLSSRPPHSITGFSAPKITSSWVCNLENTIVGGFENGYKYGEHLTVSGAVIAEACYNGHVFDRSNHLPVAHLKSYWCAIDVLITTTDANIKVILDTETSATGKWYDNIATISDTNNGGKGHLEYSIIEESVGINQSKFKKIGALQMECIPVITQGRWNGLATTNYNLSSLDAFRENGLGASGDIALNVLTQANGHYELGKPYNFRQGGLGQIVVTPASGVTFLPYETLKTRKQGSWLSLVQVSLNTWAITGDLEESA